MDEMHGHIEEVEKKINALSDALARLGQGGSLKELIKVIRFPGYTTPAELAFTHAMLDAMLAATHSLGKMEGDLLAAGKQVTQRQNVQ